MLGKLKAGDIPAETRTKAIQAMIAADGPFLLHVSISAKENVWPLVPPGASNDDTMEEKR